MSQGRILVTGASGFVGRRLLERLARDEKHIIGMHHRPLARTTALRFGGTVQWIEGDLTASDLGLALRGVDTVYHLAAYSSLSESVSDCEQLDRTNVVGTRRLAEASKKAGVRRLVFASSIAACEESAAQIIDESNGWPVSSYGKSKKAAEDALLALSDDAFTVTALRATALFGEDHLGSIYELTRAICHRRFAIFGRGGNRTNFYYVGDFVEAMVAVGPSDTTAGQVFIAADKPFALNDLANMISTACGMARNVPHLPVSVGLAAGAACDLASRMTGRQLPFSGRRARAMVRDIAYSGQKLERTTGLRPTHGVPEGITRTVKWFRATGLLD